MATIRAQSWQEIKHFVDARGIHTLQYLERFSSYELVAIDGPFSLEYSLSKNPADPSELNDFLTNYKPFSNLPLGNYNFSSDRKLKVDAELTKLVPGSISTINNKLRYDDMNVSNGGVSRDSSISNSSYTTLYSYSGSGQIIGFTITFEGNIVSSDGFLIRFSVDSQQVFEIDTSDLDSGIWGLEANEDSSFLGLHVIDKKSFRFRVPKDLAMSFSSNVLIQARKVSGGNRKFRGGLVALVKD